MWESIKRRCETTQRHNNKTEPKMGVKVLVFLSLVAFAVADDLVVDEANQKVVDECLEENNLSEETVHEFAQQDPTTATPEIKEFFYCITKKLGTFDGVNWNMEKIKEVVRDEDRLKQVEECLAKDDKTAEPRERNFAVVTCCMEKEAFL